MNKKEKQFEEILENNKKKIDACIQDIENSSRTFNRIFKDIIHSF